MFGLNSHIVNFIGACIRWTWGQIRRPLFGGPKFTFREYLDGPKDGDIVIDKIGHGCINHVIGVIILFILIYILGTYILS